MRARTSPCARCWARAATTSPWSPTGGQPDARSALAGGWVLVASGDYAAVVFNRGRRAAGPFAVEFLRDSIAIGTVQVTGLAPQTPVTVMLPGAPCAPGTPLEAVVDPRSQVDEADEENDSLSVFC